MAGCTSAKKILAVNTDRRHRFRGADDARHRGLHEVLPAISAERGGCSEAGASGSPARAGSERARPPGVRTRESQSGVAAPVAVRSGVAASLPGRAVAGDACLRLLARSVALAGGIFARRAMLLVGIVRIGQPSDRSGDAAEAGAQRGGRRARSAQAPPATRSPGSCTRSSSGGSSFCCRRS